MGACFLEYAAFQALDVVKRRQVHDSLLANCASSVTTQPAQLPTDPPAEPTPDPTPDPTPEPTPDPTTGPTTEPTPDPAPEPTLINVSSPQVTGTPKVGQTLTASPGTWPAQPDAVTYQWSRLRSWGLCGDPAMPSRREPAGQRGDKGRADL
jgi:hypothetical protein